MILVTITILKGSLINTHNTLGSRSFAPKAFICSSDIQYADYMG